MVLSLRQSIKYEVTIIIGHGFSKYQVPASFMVSSLLYILFITVVIMFVLSRESEMTSLSLQGQSKFCVRTTFPEPYLVDYIKYVVIVVV